LELFSKKKPDFVCIMKIIIHLQPILIHQTNTKMKKVVTLIAIAGAFAFVACGPSAADKEKAAHKADSLKQDSMNKASAAAMAAAQKKQDSIKAAMPKDSTAKDTMKKK
jgi:hypothetical protein